MALLSLLAACDRLAFSPWKEKSWVTTVSHTATEWWRRLWHFPPHMARYGCLMRPTVELKQGAQLVVYERRMLHHSFSRLKEELDRAGEVDPVVRNAYLESFLLHFRNVLDFLSPPPSSRDDDVKAGDFVPGYVASSAPVEYRRSINTRLSHLTYQRLNHLPDAEGWLVSEMLKEIEVAWTSFQDALSEEQPIRVAWFGPQTDTASVGIPARVEVTGVVAATTNQTIMTTIAFDSRA